MLGLKGEKVFLSDYDKSWRKAAEEKRKDMKKIFGQSALEIIHIGSTSIKNMKALPIIDLMVVVRNLDNHHSVIDIMKKNGYSKSEYSSDNEIVFYCGDRKKKVKTFFIHIVIHGTMEYYNHLNFKDYMNINTLKRKEYESLKTDLAEKFPDDLTSYYKGKRVFYKKILREAYDWKTLGRTVTVNVCENDSESVNSRVKNGFIYGIKDADGNWQPTIVIGPQKPINKFYGKVTAVIHIKDSEKTVWILVPVNKILYEPEIKETIAFDDNFKEDFIICLYEKSCGAVVYFLDKGEPYYLLIKNKSKNIGFPKGHTELHENEIQTAEREILEETNIHVKFEDNFRECYNYFVGFFIKKQAVYFLAKAEEGTIEIPDDILSYHIASYKEALGLLSFTKERIILKNAHLHILSTF